MGVLPRRIAIPGLRLLTQEVVPSRHWPGCWQARAQGVALGAYFAPQGVAAGGALQRDHAVEDAPRLGRRAAQLRRSVLAQPRPQGAEAFRQVGPPFRFTGALAFPCTVAHLLPAVMEAAHAGVELVVVTADRPARMRGTGANQTTDQVGVFGVFAPTTVVEQGPVAVASTGGPAHLNVHLDEPLLPADPWSDPPAAGAWRRSWPAGDTAPLPAGPRTVVVAGDDAGGERGTQEQPRTELHTHHPLASTDGTPPCILHACHRRAKPT